MEGIPNLDQGEVKAFLVKENEGEKLNVSFLSGQLIFCANVPFF